MGYDAQNNYYNPSERTLSPKNTTKLTQKWQFTVDGIPPGSPVVAEGLVFVMASGGTYALDLDTGKQVWKHDDIVGTASLSYASGFVYAHTTPGANLYKLKAKDGTVVWGPVPSYDSDLCDGTSSPIVSSGKVLVGHSCGSAEIGSAQDAMSVRGGVEAFDTEDGTHLWTYWTVPSDSDEDGAMVWSTVSVDSESETVFATTGNNYTARGSHSDAIHAINLSDGTGKWVTQVREGDVFSLVELGQSDAGADTDFGANPILAEIAGRKIVAAGDKGSAFWELDRETGELIAGRMDLSSSHSAANGGVLMNGAFDGRYFYVISNEPQLSSDQPAPDALLHVLDPQNNLDDRRPALRLGAISWGAASLANGLLVVPTGSALEIYDADSGERLNRFETGGTIAGGAAAIVEGKIIVKSGLEYILDTTVENNNQIICYGLP